MGESRGVLRRAASIPAALLVMLASVVAVLAPTLEARAADALDHRFGRHQGEQRIVLELSEPAPHRIFTLENPFRVVIDLPELNWMFSAPKPPEGVVKAVRFGLFQPGRSRMVLDLSRPARVTQAFTLEAGGGKPARLVIDLASQDAGTFSQTAGWPSDAKLVAGPPTPRPRPVSIGGPRPLVIALDPGHGGVDPGAMRGGVVEKTLALRFTRLLKKELEQTGRYQVIMTRDSDVYVPLRERVERARRARADLFLSIHADAVEVGDAHGASVYTLSDEASDHEAAELAAQENLSDVIAGVRLTHEDDVVARVLIDLAQNETMIESRRFAATLIHQLGQSVGVLKTRPSRAAGFRVLKAPDVPSVLVEIGFLSSDADLKRMQQPVWRRKAALAIVEAIDLWANGGVSH
jgi:N-acetylmuramoyl-L-alanine amidase